MGNIAFPFAVSGGVLLSGDYERCIRDSVRIILTTKPGERLMNPDFGVNINAYLFGNMDSTAIENIRTDVINALCTWERRISNIEADVRTEDGRLEINLSYSIVSLGAPDCMSVVYDFPGG